MKWGVVVVVRMEKRKGPKTNSANYRSIFLSKTTGKLYASVLATLSKAYLTEKLTKTQFRFHEGRSFEQAIFRNANINPESLGPKKGNVFVDPTESF